MRSCPFANWSLLAAWSGLVCVASVCAVPEGVFAQTQQRDRTTEQRRPVPPVRVIPNPQSPQFPGDLVAPGHNDGKKATIDVSCGSKSFTISTGSDQGTCTSTPPGSGGGGGGSCSDSNGNSASVSCDTGCLGASGSGSCSGS